MIPCYLSAAFNHLWQSTLVVAMVGTLALAERSQSQSPPRPPSQPSSAEKLTFDAASIKPAKPGAKGGIHYERGGRFTATNVSLKRLVTIAYHIQPFQLMGAPSWLESDLYDIEATPDSSADSAPVEPPADPRKQSEDQRKRLQALLEDRCKLTYHRETKELPVYALVVAKGGPKLKESPVTPGKPSDLLMMRMGEMHGRQVSLSFFADSLSRQLGRVVLDRTGVNGNYDFDLKWTPDPTQRMEMEGPPMGPGGPGGPGMPPPPDPNGPTIFTAIQEQLGLKLESQKGPVDTIVIDHIEKPSEN